MDYAVTRATAGQAAAIEGTPDAKRRAPGDLDTAHGQAIAQALAEKGMRATSLALTGDTKAPSITFEAQVEGTGGEAHAVRGAWLPASKGLAIYQSNPIVAPKAGAARTAPESANATPDRAPRAPTRAVVVAAVVDRRDPDAVPGIPLLSTILNAQGVLRIAAPGSLAVAKTLLAILTYVDGKTLASKSLLRSVALDTVVWAGFAVASTAGAQALTIAVVAKALLFGGYHAWRTVRAEIDQP